MYGAIIGDTVGSIYEWHNIKTKNFPLFQKRCFLTDDSYMTIAVASALLSMEDGNLGSFRDELVSEFHRIGSAYPRAGYGGGFKRWLQEDDYEPYYSCGNGSAMRVSPCAWAARTLEQAEALAEASADVTHNHPEGIKGAKATAAAIYLARSGCTRTEIRSYIREHYYPLERTLKEIRPVYKFDGTCQGTVPEAIEAFLESISFEDAIRNAISLGGDSDTLAAITGSIAEAYYGIPAGIKAQIKRFLRRDSFKQEEDIVRRFRRHYASALKDTRRTGEDRGPLERGRWEVYLADPGKTAADMIPRAIFDPAICAIKGITCPRPDAAQPAAKEAIT